MKRSAQLVIWILLAPVLGAIQGVASFSLPILRFGNLGSPDLRRLLVGLPLVYGGGWFTPTLVISDLFLLRRTLSRHDFTGYASLIAVTALLLGFLMPGMMVMIGYPITAAAILGCGFLYRRKGESTPITVSREPE